MAGRQAMAPWVVMGSNSSTQRRPQLPHSRMASCQGLPHTPGGRSPTVPAGHAVHDLVGSLIIQGYGTVPEIGPAKLIGFSG